MRVDKPPFNDVRVRQAMRLIADRKQLVENVLRGFGTIGNDIPGPGLPLYDSSLPQRTQNIDKAKSLLKAAGREGLTVTLQTTSGFPGFVEAATLFANQAQAAGVNVKLKLEPISAYFDSSQLYTKMTFAEDSLNPMASIDDIYTVNLTSTGPYNETHWDYPSFDKLVAQARGSTWARAAEMYNEIQKQFYSSGSYIIWGQPDYVDALSLKVRGLTPHKLGNASNYRFANAWLT
jgi:peptide/nickel transport system substrate-binding protein